MVPREAGRESTTIRPKEREEMFKRFFGDESGAAMVEYGLLVALIAVVVMAAVGPLGTAVRDTFDTVTSELGGTGSGGAGGG